MEKSPSKQGTRIFVMSWDLPGTLLHADVHLVDRFHPSSFQAKECSFESCDITDAILLKLHLGQLLV